MATITSTHPTRPVQPPPGRIYRFFHSGRGDSPFRRLWINALLILACFIAIYPVLRVFSVSLRPGNQLLSTSLNIIPENATLDNYTRLFTEKAFLVWVWNSIIITDRRRDHRRGAGRDQRLCLLALEVPHAQPVHWCSCSRPR